MFGGFSSTNTSTGAAGGSLFGAKPATTTGSFGFGNTTASGSTFPSFGASTTTTSAPLFGSTATAPGSLFGNTTTSSLVGKPTTTTTALQSTAPTGLSFGTNPTQNPTANTASNITLKSKFSDLPEQLRKNVEEIEQFISSQVQIADTTKNSVMDTPISGIQQQCQQLSNRLIGLRNLLERDMNHLEALKKSVMQESRNSDLATRYLDRLTTSGPPTYMLPSHDTYANYFTQFADNLEKQMLEYRQVLEDLEATLRSKYSVQIQSQQMTPHVVQEIIKSQHESFLSLAKQVANLHDSVEKEHVKFVQMEQRMGHALHGVGGLRGQVEDVPLSMIASHTLKPMASAPPQASVAAAGSTTAPGGFGFGGLATTNATSNPTPAFGQASSSLFGAKPATTTAGTTGFSLGGASTAAPSFAVPAPTINTGAPAFGTSAKRTATSSGFGTSFGSKK